VRSVPLTRVACTDSISPRTPQLDRGFQLAADLTGTSIHLSLNTGVEMEGFGMVREGRNNIIGGKYIFISDLLGLRKDGLLSKGVRASACSLHMIGLL